MSDDDNGFFTPLDMHAADQSIEKRPILLGALEVGVGIALGLAFTLGLAYLYFTAAGV
jgi:hypothetical protein